MKSAGHHWGYESVYTEIAMGHWRNHTLIKSLVTNVGPHDTPLVPDEHHVI